MAHFLGLSLWNKWRTVHIECANGPRAWYKQEAFGGGTGSSFFLHCLFGLE